VVGLVAAVDTDARGTPRNRFKFLVWMRHCEFGCTTPTVRWTGVWAGGQRCQTRSVLQLAECNISVATEARVVARYAAAWRRTRKHSPHAS
jgi:hypothetical protein